MRMLLLLIAIIALTGCTERSVRSVEIDRFPFQRYTDLYHDALPKGKSPVLLRLPWTGVPLGRHYTITVTINGMAPAACAGSGPCVH